MIPARSIISRHKQVPWHTHTHTHTHLLVILYVLTVNNRRLVLHRTFWSNLPVVFINSVTKYVGLLQGFTSTPKTIILFVTYTAGLAMVNLTGGVAYFPTCTFCGMEKMFIFFCKEALVTIYIYIYIRGSLNRFPDFFSYGHFYW